MSTPSHPSRRRAAAVTKIGTAAPHARLKMKDLERATGVGRESIRYYIREGLLPEPRRPGRNVAWYDESFVARIKLIKELQQTRYLPLSVIKTIVAGDAPPTAAEVAALGQIDGKLADTNDATTTAPERLSALSQRTGLPVREIRELAAADAFPITTRDGDHWIDGTGVRLVELWAGFRRAGYTSERDFDPSQIRLYVEMVRWLAREELRVFTKGLAGRVDANTLARMAEDGIRLGNEVVALLRRATLLRFISEGNLPESDATPVTKKTSDESR